MQKCSRKNAEIANTNNISIEAFNLVQGAIPKKEHDGEDWSATEPGGN